MKNIRITTKSGFKCTIDVDNMSTLEFLDAVAKQNSKNKADQMLGYMEMANILLGDGGLEAIKKHISPDGELTPLSKFDAELTEIIQLAGAQAKK